MTISRRNALLVGQSFASAEALKDRLRRWGFCCCLAANIQAAFEFLEFHGAEIVLADRHLPDGTGFELAVSLEGRPVTVFVSVPIEDSCLWLPAIRQGKICWGSPALRPSEFASSLEAIAGNVPQVVSSS
jgi:DNA-binding NtrC family response regulator